MTGLKAMVLMVIRPKGLKTNPIGQRGGGGLEKRKARSNAGKPGGSLKEENKRTCQANDYGTC